MPPRRPPRRLNHEPKAVKYARKQAGLTQAQVAERCGVAFSLISEIEKGTRSATDAMLNKLAAALNCPRVVLEAKRGAVPGPEPAGQDGPPEGQADGPSRQGQGVMRLTSQN
jgi:transcriptional regulator with XRE-family HTH domain